MARRKATPTTPQARELATAIRQGERAGMTQKEMGRVLGINPRTIRKIKTGQTSGRRTFARVTRAPAQRASPNTFNAEFVVGEDADGNEVVASRNVILPDIAGTKGRRAPTALDVFRINAQLQRVAADERAALALRYGVTTPADADSPIKLRAIGRVRRPEITLSQGAP